MRRILFALLLAAIPVAAAEAGIGVGPIKGNDTGGIIAWSPQNQHDARMIAVDHCAHYGRVARITSVWPRYGQYIVFSCRLPVSYYVTHHSHRRAHATLRVRD